MDNLIKANSEVSQTSVDEYYCKFCGQFLEYDDFNDQNVIMLQSSQCFHKVHKKCLVTDAFNKLSQNIQVRCPTCKQDIQQYEIDSYLDQDQQQSIQVNQKKQFLSENPNFVECACGNIMDFVQGQVQKDQKDDNGQIMSEEASIHMARNRIRCYECTKNFCISCKVEPYHVGRVCNQLNQAECRFCEEQIKQPSVIQKKAFENVCQKKECIDLCQGFCDKLKNCCGNPCCGYVNEQICLPCLEPGCNIQVDQIDSQNKSQAKKDDWCSICFCDKLGQAPCCQLDCGHIIHIECIKQQVQKKWNGPRIVFNYLSCPQCKQIISSQKVPILQQLIQKDRELYNKIEKMALERAKAENLQNDPRLKTVGDVYFNDLKGFALHKLSFFECFKCKEPYYGGMNECGEGREFQKEDLMCGKCVAEQWKGLGKTNCDIHGSEYIEFKCQFCCTIALWYCHGTTHYCEPCHQNNAAQRAKKKEDLPKCSGPHQCPLKVQHPPNGNEFSLGCGLCRTQVLQGQK